MKKPPLLFHDHTIVTAEEEIPKGQPDPKSECCQNCVLLFLYQNQNPTDDQVHAWSEERGMNHEAVEEEIYRLASAFAKFALGGEANEKSISEKDVDPEQLRMGVEVEFEHTTDPETAKRIALDHLAEIGDYYSRLAKMEADAGVED